MGRDLKSGPGKMINYTMSVLNMPVLIPVVVRGKKV